MVEHGFIVTFSDYCDVKTKSGSCQLLYMAAVGPKYFIDVDVLLLSIDTP